MTYPNPNPSSRPWKPGIALERLRGDERLLRELIAFFLEDFRPLLAELKSTLADGDLAGAERAAHSLKGLSATFEAEQAVEGARRIEKACGDHDLAQAREVVSEFEAALRLLGEDMQNY